MEIVNYAIFFMQWNYLKDMELKDGNNYINDSSLHPGVVRTELVREMM